MKEKNKIKLFGTLQVMTVSAALVAISIVCGKYLAINLGQALRFSFENLPIILAGIMFGPIVGAVVGGVSDLVGALLVYGGDMNPLVTVGAVSIGLISGLLWKCSKKLPYGVRLLLSVTCAHVIGSIILKSIGLSAWYLANLNMPIYILMLWRTLNYIIVGGAEFIILFFVLKNKTIRSKMLINQ